jgi:ParB-like nuclease domain
LGGDDVSADRSILKEIKIADIRVGSRHRRDMGDLTALADSIRREGLLQPVGVTDGLELAFGQRRIRAVRDVLKKKTILARVVDVTSILAGEYHENEVRKDFTPSERVAIARAIERQVGNRRGQRTDRLRGKIDTSRSTRHDSAVRQGMARTSVRSGGRKAAGVPPAFGEEWPGYGTDGSSRQEAATWPQVPWSRTP